MRYYLLNKNRSNLLRKSVFKPSKFLANLLINKSIKRSEEAYFNILKHNEVFFNQKHKKLCQLGSQYIECSCEECRK